MATGPLPQPGWESSADWRARFRLKTCWAYNPPAGYIATANNRVVGPSYPYLITTQYDLGYRADRIVELLGASNSLTAEDMRAIQGNSYNPAGPRLTPYLIDLDFHEPGEDDPARKQADKLMSAVSLLRDPGTTRTRPTHPRRPSSTRPGATWCCGPSGTTFPRVGSREMMARSLCSPPCCHGQPIPGGTTCALDPWRPATKSCAWPSATPWRSSKIAWARPRRRWSWGALHGATFRNETLGESGIAPIEALFNRGPFPTSGGASIVNATGWELEADYQVAWVPASMRAIYDLSDWERSLAIDTTGQSGHAFHPHYIDMAPLWARIEYAPLPFGRAQVELLAKERLVLVP